MKAPDVRHTVRDSTRQVTFHVMAYRKLTTQEVHLSIRQLLAQPSIRRKKHQLRNQVITILTVYGTTPGL